jgi:hypothetical protein
MIKKGVIYTARKGFDARNCHPKNRTIDSTKNHLKVLGKYKLIIDEPR